MNESPEEIVWNKLLKSLVNMFNMKTLTIEAERDFRLGKTGFNSLKSKNLSLERSELELKSSFDEYVLNLIKNGKETI